MNTNEMISTLDQILEKGKMSDDLRKAIIELKEALLQSDLDLAYEVSAVKSYVAGMRAGPENHFTEDTEHNRIALGRDIYCLLDTLHHDLAFSINKMPSGMMIVSADGWRQKGQPERTSPTLALIVQEHEAIVDRAQNRQS
jgi:hypothetical protein